jgi:CheY-like chemotaxis protein
MTTDSIKPIDLVLTDFQMPYKNGVEVVCAVNSYFDEKIKIYPFVNITKPRFIINTAFKSLELKKLMLLYRLESEDVIDEKPIPLGQLKEII